MFPVNQHHSYLGGLPINGYDGNIRNDRLDEDHVPSGQLCGAQIA